MWTWPLRAATTVCRSAAAALSVKAPPGLLTVVRLAYRPVFAYSPMFLPACQSENKRVGTGPSNTVEHDDPTSSSSGQMGQ